MSERRRSDNAPKSVSLASKKSNPKPNQKSILDLFPRKPKPAPPSSANTSRNDFQEAHQKQEQPEPQIKPYLAVETQSGLNFPSPEFSVPASPVQQYTSVQTTPTQIINLDETRSASPEIQIIESITSPTGLKGDPIVLESPVKPSFSRSVVAPPPKPVYSIFAPQARKDPSVLPVTTHRPSHREALFPDHTSQHVRGQQTSFSVPPMSLPPRRHVSCASSSSVLLSDIFPLEAESSPDSADVLTVRVPTSHSARVAHLSTIPGEHLQLYPVIAHLVQAALSESETANVSSPSHSHRLWTDKWHPSRADHVLGNEEQARFLQEWLSALEVSFTYPPAPEGRNLPGSQSSGKPKATEKQQGTKRPSVVRAVEKRGRRKRRRIDSDEDDDDSWIVHSDNIVADDDESLHVQFFDHPEKPLENALPRLYRRPSSADYTLTSRPYARHTLQNHFTNTILLSGPHSSGKTASVYACAKQLGWEVFEVYPGVGKRSGANLDNLVGEVGKNHLVRKTTRLQNIDPGTNTKRDGLLKSAFLRGTGTRMQDDSRESAFGFMEEPNGPGVEKQHEATPRQSLILVEEVDVLFKEDINFWGALINLIRDCKRPVILTCNDISLVPVTDLPLQDVLNFRLCSTTVATSYLQALCCAEGYLVDRSALSRFYDNPGSLEIDLYTPDLRRAIHNLQLWCPANEKGTRAAICYQDDEKIEDALPWDWHSIETESSDASTRQTYSIDATDAYHAELVSFADCYLLRKFADMPKEMSLEETAFNGTDDILGYRTLCATSARSVFKQFGYHDRDELIMSSAIELSRGAHDKPASSSRLETTRALLRTRVQYDAVVQEIRHNVVAARSQIIRTPVFDLEYLPWIREMVAADDRQEEAMRRRDESVVGRRTRNSQKFVRTIELSENVHRALDQTVLQ